MIKLANLTMLLLLTVASAGEEAINERTFRGTNYLILRANPTDIRLHWKDASGKPIKTLARLTSLLKADGREVTMVTNAGIYTPTPAPEGLHVEGGKKRLPLNTKSGYGNFYLEPNGVFFIDQKNRARVLSTADYQKQKAKPRLATQSGPLLLAEGKIHPKFNQDSKSKKQRSGVGVDKDGKVWFACVEAGDVTNFFNFAEFFLKELGCEQALYLDGTISRMSGGDGGETQAVDFVGMFSVSVAGKE